MKKDIINQLGENRGDYFRISGASAENAAYRMLDFLASWGFILTYQCGGAYQHSGYTDPALGCSVFYKFLL